MNLQEIINFTRHSLGNYEPPYYWTDTELVFLCNQVINQFTRDTKISIDSATPAVVDISTTANTFDYSLSALNVSILSARLVTEEVLTLDVAPSTAWAAADTITGASSGKTCTVVSKLTSTTYTVDSRSGIYTLGEILSNGTYTANQGASYPTFTDYESTELIKTTRSEIDEYIPTWRVDTSGEPTKYLLDNRTGYITLYPVPDAVYIVRLTTLRDQLTALSSTTTLSTQTPELDAKYHNDIIQGICGYACLKSGTNTYNEKKAAAHMAFFRKAVNDTKARVMLNNSAASTQGPHGGFV